MAATSAIIANSSCCRMWRYGEASEPEHIEHGGGRCVLQLRGHSRDERRLPRPHEHGNVLLAVDGVAHSRRVDAGADIEAPQLLQAFGIVRRERAVGMAEEHQVSGRRERAAVIRVIELEPRLDLAGRRIDRLEAAVKPLGGLLRAASEALARLDGAALVDEVLLLHRFEEIAALDG